MADPKDLSIIFFENIKGYLTKAQDDAEALKRIGQFLTATTETPQQNEENIQTYREAINDVSNIPIAQSQDYLDIGPNITQFQFPLSGAIDLQIGKLYVWQISRTFETTIGTNLAKSNIFLFKIKSVSESREMLDSYSSTIIDFIGESTYNQYFGSNGDLSGFSLSGNSILINNESVPIGQLNNFSNQLNQGAISIISIEVE